MAKKNRYTPQEAADKLGIPLGEVRSFIATDLLPTEDGLVTLEDILAVKRVKVNDRDEESLRNRVAVLQKRLLEYEGMVAHLLRIAGIWKYNRDFTDETLIQLAGMGEAGITGFGLVRTDRIAHLIDLVSILSERELHRMELLTGKSRVWVGLHALLSDLIDAMTGRLEHAQNLDVQRLRMETGLARNHIESQAKFLLALQDPECQPDRLFGMLTIQASRMTAGNENKAFSIKDAMKALLDREESKGRCPGAE